MTVYYPIGYTRISLTDPQASIVRVRDCFKSLTIIDDDTMLKISATLS